MGVGEIVVHKLKPNLKMIIVDEKGNIFSVRYWDEYLSKFLYEEFYKVELRSGMETFILSGI